MDCAQERSISATSSSRNADRWTKQLCPSAGVIWGHDPPCSNFSSWEMTPFSCVFSPLYPKARWLVVFATAFLVVRAAALVQMLFRPLEVSGVCHFPFSFCLHKTVDRHTAQVELCVTGGNTSFFSPFLDQVVCDLTW